MSTLPVQKAHKTERWRAQVPGCLTPASELLTPGGGCNGERWACLAVEKLGQTKAALPLERWEAGAASPWEEAPHSKV